VHVRRQRVWIVERADPHETGQRPRARIVTPDCDAAVRAAGNLLPFPAMSWGIEDVGLQASIEQPSGGNGQPGNRTRLRAGMV
jgi:hypothetical protein